MNAFHFSNIIIYLFRLLIMRSQLMYEMHEYGWSDAQLIQNTQNRQHMRHSNTDTCFSCASRLS